MCTIALYNYYILKKTRRTEQPSSLYESIEYIKH